MQRCHIDSLEIIQMQMSMLFWVYMTQSQTLIESSNSSCENTTIPIACRQVYGSFFIVIDVWVINPFSVVPFLGRWFRVFTKTNSVLREQSKEKSSSRAFALILASKFLHWIPVLVCDLRVVKRNKSFLPHVGFSHDVADNRNPN